MILIKIIYSFLVGCRNFLYDKNILKSYQSCIPIISVGNITVGGTGKTPFVIFLANYLKKNNHRPLIITRGYKRKTTKQIILTKNHNFSVEDVGDEALLLVSACDDVDVLVNKNRVDAVKWAEQQTKKYTCIILDDAFQHRAINRNFNILLISPEQKMNNYPPIGELREPVKNIRRADAIVFTKGKNVNNKLQSIVKLFNIPCFESDIDFKIKKPNKDKDCLKSCVSFCGIGNPHFFINTIKKLLIAPKEHISFQDHQSYTDSTVQKIEASLKKHNVKTFITTRKDWIKLPKGFLNKYTGICIDMFISIDMSEKHSNFKSLLFKKIEPK